MIIPIVLNKDCLEALKRMDSDIFDLALLDPPYFDYKTGHRKDKESKLSQSLVQQDRSDQLEVVKESIRVLKPGGAFYFFTNWQEAWWFQQQFHTFLRNEIVWDKGNRTAGDLMGSFGNQYEVIFLGTKGKGWTYKGAREPDIWTIPRVGSNRIHATQKPVSLYQKIIENSTDKGDFILDPYIGSGASIIAALKLDRNIIGYEIDPEYYKRVLERIEFFKKEGKDAFD